jgi:hypothetical protein
VDNFGHSLNTGGFNNDGFADIAIAVPGEVIGRVDVGVATGSTSRPLALHPPATSRGTRIAQVVEEVAEDGDFFGSSFA